MAGFLLQFFGLPGHIPRQNTPRTAEVLAEALRPASQNFQRSILVTSVFTSKAKQTQHVGQSCQRPTRKRGTRDDKLSEERSDLSAAYVHNFAVR